MKAIIYPYLQIYLVIILITIIMIYFVQLYIFIIIRLMSTYNIFIGNERFHIEYGY